MDLNKISQFYETGVLTVGNPQKNGEKGLVNYISLLDKYYNKAGIE